MKIGLFYGSSTCYTEIVAEKIRDYLGADLVELHNLNQCDPQLMEQYDLLILGIPTWDFGELQEDWENNWSALTTLKLEHKIVALFGLGDQIGYSEWFLDALGMLHDHLIPQQVNFIGYWPVEGYDFINSKALTADGKFFVGLALDEVNQYELSDERIQQWCDQLLLEIETLL